MQTSINEETRSETNLNSLAFLLALGGVAVGVGMGVVGGTFLLAAASEHLRNKAMICAISGVSVAGISSSIYGLFRYCKKTDTAPNVEKIVTEQSNLLKV